MARRKNKRRFALSRTVVDTDKVKYILNETLMLEIKLYQHALMRSDLRPVLENLPSNGIGSIRVYCGFNSENYELFRYPSLIKRGMAIGCRRFDEKNTKIIEAWALASEAFING